MAFALLLSWEREDACAGYIPEISLEDARNKRLEARKLIVNGIDPGEKKKEDKRQAHFKAENTFEAVAGEWFETNKPKWIPCQPLLNAAPAIESDEAIIHKARSAQNGNKFEALWNGDSSILNGADRSGSAIDQALVSIIQFYSKDPEQIERIWVSSPQGKEKRQEPEPITVNARYTMDNG